MVKKTGHSGFMGYGDLWVMGICGDFFAEFIYNQSMLGFMGIYGKPLGDIKSP